MSSNATSTLAQPLVSIGLPVYNGVDYLGEALNNPPSVVWASRGLGLLSLRKGELQEAIPTLEHSLLLCRTMDLAVMFPQAAAQLGYAYALSGRATEGLPLLEQALERGDAMGLMLEQSQRATWLGEAYLHAGRLDDALRLAGRAFDLARAHKERGNEAWVLRLLGEVAAHADPPDVKSAEEHYRQALALADELEMRPLVAHCHLGLGTLYRRTGDSAKAKEHLTTAARMYREMGMGFWLGKAEAARAGGDP
jgi:tetratricopeptide (TPR) repeat protein